MELARAILHHSVKGWRKLMTNSDLRPPKEVRDESRPSYSDLRGVPRNRLVRPFLLRHCWKRLERGIADIQLRFSPDTGYGRWRRDRRGHPHYHRCALLHLGDFRVVGNLPHRPRQNPRGAGEYAKPKSSKGADTRTRFTLSGPPADPVRDAVKKDGFSYRDTPRTSQKGRR